jgi:hypothetical protein
MSDEPFVEKETEKNADGEQKDPCEKIFKSVSEAFKSGTEKAKKKAEESAPTIKSALGKAAFQLSYGAAYGGSFGLTLLKEFVPKVVRDGGAEGFGAGKEAARRSTSPKPKAAEGGEIIDVDYSVS